MVKKAGGRLSKGKREQLLSDLRELFKTKEIKYYSIRKLSNKFNIAKDTVQKYLDEVSAEFPQDEVIEVQLKFKSLFDSAILTCEELVKRAVEEDRERDIRENIKLLLDTIKQQTDFMERFFIKDKAQDNINIQGEIKTVNVHFLQEISELE